MNRAIIEFSYVNCGNVREKAAQLQVSGPLVSTTVLVLECGSLEESNFTFRVDSSRLHGRTLTEGLQLQESLHSLAVGPGS